MPLFAQGFDRYGVTVNWYGHTNIQQIKSYTDTPFQNLYQTDTDADICFEIHIELILWVLNTLRDTKVATQTCWKNMILRK